MSEEESLLFVGGPADGQLHKVYHSYVWAVAVPVEMAPDMEAFYGTAPSSAPSSNVVYSRMRFRGAHAVHTVMAAEGMDADAVLAALIGNYAPIALRNAEEINSRLERLRAVLDEMREQRDYYIKQLGRWAGKDGPPARLDERKESHDLQTGKGDNEVR